MKPTFWAAAGPTTQRGGEAGEAWVTPTASVAVALPLGST